MKTLLPILPDIKRKGQSIISSIAVPRKGQSIISSIAVPSGAWGFTLIEVLLALFITAMIVSMLSVVLTITLRSYRQGKDLFNIADRAQLVMSQLTRELKGAMVQSHGGNTIIPFIGEAQAVYFMAPVDNDSAVDLCELGYLFDSADNRIMRHYLTAAASSGYDYPNDVEYTATAGSRSTFSSNVTDLSFRYFDEDGWQQFWPAAKEDELPHMVEINLTVQGEYPADNPTQERKFSTWVYLPNYQNN